MSYGNKGTLIDRYFPLVFIAGFCAVLLLAMPWIMVGFAHYLKWVETFK